MPASRQNSLSLRMRIFSSSALRSFWLLSAVGNPSAPHDDHRRPGGHLVGGRAAKTDHQRLRFLAAKRRKFSSKDDDLIRERVFAGHAVLWDESCLRAPCALR